ncbi:MAG: CBS domain-containing protein [Thermomicrobiales bacterium]
MILTGVWCLPLDAPRPYIGLALTATGWHLAVTSAWSRRQIVWQHRSQSILLSRYVPGLVLPPEASLAQAARLVLEFRVPVLVIATDGSVPGVITRQTLREHPRADWARIPLGRAMVPIGSLPALPVEETVTTAATLLRDTGQSILVVYSGGHPRAAVTLAQLVETLPI